MEKTDFARLIVLTLKTQIKRGMLTKREERWTKWLEGYLNAHGDLGKYEENARKMMVRIIVDRPVPLLPL